MDGNGKAKKGIAFDAESPDIGVMVTKHLVPGDLLASYQVEEWRNAAGILQTAHHDEWQDIIACLRSFQFLRSEVLKGGGRKSVIAQRTNCCQGLKVAAVGGVLFWSLESHEKSTLKTLPR